MFIRILNTIIFYLLIFISILLINRIIEFHTLPVFVIDGISVMFSFYLIYLIFYKSRGHYIFQIYKWIFKLRDWNFSIRSIRYFPLFDFNIGLQEGRHTVTIGVDYSEWFTIMFQTPVFGFEIQFMDWKEEFSNPYYQSHHENVPKKWMKYYGLGEYYTTYLWDKFGLE